MKWNINNHLSIDRGPFVHVEGEHGGVACSVAVFYRYDSTPDVMDGAVLRAKRSVACSLAALQTFRTNDHREAFLRLDKASGAMRAEYKWLRDKLLTE